MPDTWRALSVARFTTVGGQTMDHGVRFKQLTDEQTDTTSTIPNRSKYLASAIGGELYNFGRPRTGKRDGACKHDAHYRPRGIQQWVAKY